MSWFSHISLWAKSLDDKWKLAQTNGQIFSEFAFQQMENHSFHKDFELQKNIQEILELKTYPLQASPHSDFGNPPITLYYSEDKTFYLDLYIWQGSQTSIHQHNFEGAFTVIQGQSLETVYSFLSQKEMGPSQWGILRQKEFNHLRPGDVRQIYLRDGLVHRVLHLSTPTISLVLRTGKSKNLLSLPQFNYDFGLLASPGFPPDDIVGKFRALEWYLSSGHVPTFKMVEPLLPYARLWSRLSQHSQAKILMHKLAIIQNGPDLIKGIEKQNLFLKIFSDIKDEDEKILLSAFEYFGEGWTTWIEKNFSLPPEESQRKLELAIKSLPWFNEELVKFTFLKDLFESIHHRD